MQFPLEKLATYQLNLQIVDSETSKSCRGNSLE